MNDDEADSDRGFNDFLNFVHGESAITEDYSNSVHFQDNNNTNTNNSNAGDDVELGTNTSRKAEERNNGSSVVTRGAHGEYSGSHVVSSSSRVSMGHSSRRNSLGRRASTTEDRRNPFALREGHALIWRNINMVLVGIQMYVLVIYTELINLLVSCAHIIILQLQLHTHSTHIIHHIIFTTYQTYRTISKVKESF